MKCGFCGHELTEEGIEKACKGCSAFGGCRLVKCPNCGYEQPQQPKWLKALVQLMAKKQAKFFFSPQQESIPSTNQEKKISSELAQMTPLSELRTGASARVVQIVHDPEGHWRKLNALGIVPGATVCLIQRFPTYVVQVGLSQLALDRQLTSQVLVEETPPTRYPQAHPEATDTPQ